MRFKNCYFAPNLTKNRFEPKTLAHIDRYHWHKSNRYIQRLNFPDNPLMYDKKTEKNIEVYVMEWSELIEQNNRKLGYLANKLNIKDKSVKIKFEKEYAELIDEKISAQLRLVK